MQLLEHFKELTVHPKNAKELKGLILQLAIQGKLTKKWRESQAASHPDRHLDQRERTETAAELLEKIKAEKARLVKEKKIKKEKPLPEITEEEIPFELPEGWAWCRLGTYTHNLGQKKPHATFEYIDVASIDNSKGRISDKLNLIPAAEAPSRARKIIKKGCVIYSTVRPYLLNIAVVDRDFDNEAIASTAFAILNPMLGCSEYYLYHVLRSRLFIEYVESCMKGVAYPAINDGNLLNGILPLPPLSEQKAIVSIVNQLFEEVEALEEETKARVQLQEGFVTSALHQLSTGDTAKEWAFLQPHFKTFFTDKTTIKKLRESILQLAVQGKLTASWRASQADRHPERSEGTETAQELLQRIKAEKAQLIKEKKIKKEKPLPEITADEIPYELPEGWVWTNLKECFLMITDGDHQAPPKALSGIPFLVIGNVNKGELNFDNTRFVDQKYYDNLNWIRKPTKNDILYTVVGSYGIPVLVNTNTPFCIQRHIAILKTSSESYNEYLKYLLQSSVVYDQATNIATGIAQKTVSLSGLRKILIPLPPLSEQKAIVSKVNALMGLCDALEEAIEASEVQVGDLMQSCLKEVFGG